MVLAIKHQMDIIGTLALYQSSIEISKSMNRDASLNYFEYFLGFLAKILLQPSLQK
jgi:hypothetical protein